MKQIIVSFMLALLPSLFSFAQKEVKRGTCGEDVSWSFNGSTLTLTSAGKGKMGTMTNYDMGEHRAPWTRQGLNIQEVVVDKGIGNIGACAFAGCKELRRVEFGSQEDLKEIEWGAFMGCTALDDISLPNGLKKLGALSFARCTSLSDISIPDYCGVGELAFASCNQLRTLTCGPATTLEKPVFTCEKSIDGKEKLTLWTGLINRLPTYVSKANCQEFGIDTTAVEHYFQNRLATDSVDDLRVTSDVDEDIPALSVDGNQTYAIIIGNQNYRHLTGLMSVPFARHDAATFKSYLRQLPESNIRLLADATKNEMEVQFTDWINTIPNRDEKTLIVYYAGHGLPNKVNVKGKDRVQACLIPVDVSDARHGIYLDDLYKKLGDAQFGQVVVFLDACFSGKNREGGEGIRIGQRGGVIEEPTDPIFGEGKVVAFAAASHEQAAQGYDIKQHGLFTYYLLKALKNAEGDINFGRLSDEIRSHVIEASKRQRFQEQTPKITYSNKFEEDWKTATFKMNKNK